MAGTAAKLPHKLCKSRLSSRCTGQQGISCLAAQVVVGEHLKGRDLQEPRKPSCTKDTGS